MPMPVSETEKVTASPGPGLGGEADFAALGEFRGVGKEVSQNLRDLALIGVEGRNPMGSSTMSETEPWVSSRCRRPSQRFRTGPRFKASAG